METAYIVYDKNLGCRKLIFSPEGSFICFVLVEETEESLYNQYGSGIMVGDVIYSFERARNYKILKINQYHGRGDR